ncbi:hypothetical protein OSB04_001110 [Centaurea solstitialis]|uniref:Uncharacterized protein n=1 Tax=Centaurea solstitialis TaxID=347529 RepID=A0AA38WU91_9ASTR|nr:hypothetical protein OSB04_001110 [Centaurea solstitialis]
MASSSGTIATTSSDGSYSVQNSGSDEDLHRLMDKRKRKQMNPESGSKNSVLEAQAAELDESLNQMIAFMSQLPVDDGGGASGCGFSTEEMYGGGELIDELMSIPCHRRLSCIPCHR